MTTIRFAWALLAIGTLLAATPPAAADDGDDGILLLPLTPHAGPIPCVYIDASEPDVVIVPNCWGPLSSP